MTEYFKTSCRSVGPKMKKRKERRGAFSLEREERKMGGWEWCLKTTLFRCLTKGGKKTVQLGWNEYLQLYCYTHLSEEEQVLHIYTSSKISGLWLLVYHTATKTNDLIDLIHSCTFLYAYMAGMPTNNEWQKEVSSGNIKLGGEATRREISSGWRVAGKASEKHRKRDGNQCLS